MEQNLLAHPFRQLDEMQMEGHIVPEGVFGDDFYKFLMGRFIYHKYRDVDVSFGFTNRTKGVQLGEHISENDFQREFEHFRKTARLDNTGKYYLLGIQYGEDKSMFDKGYMGFLQNELEIPPVEYGKTDDGDITLVSRGKWNNVSHVEIPVLRIVNGLYIRSLLKKMSRSERYAVYAEGTRRLAEKIKFLKESGFNATISEFGNRRSAGPAWHAFVTHTLLEELPGIFPGPSKTNLAMETASTPMGTNAHEQWMVLAALSFDGTRESLEKMTLQFLTDWWEMYGYDLSIVLPDTFGSKFVFDTMTDKMIRDYKGARQDSGRVMDFAEMYRQRIILAGADSREKLLIPSDGLTVADAIEYWKILRETFRLSFGIGTHLTNDLGLQTLSIVMKTIFANGNPTVKLPDNLAKGTGPMSEQIRYKRALGYAVTYFDQPVV